MSEFNITVEGGTSKRLLTAGKYCDRDIVVTAEGGGTGWDGNLVYKNPNLEVSQGIRSFEGNEYVKNVHIEGCVGIGELAFSHACNLKNVYLGVQGSYANWRSYKIEKNAFADCAALERVECYGVYDLESRSFAYDSSLEYVLIRSRHPTAIHYSGFTVGESVFTECTNLKDVTLEATSIGEYAFYRCENLEKIELTICKAIKSFAFQDCTSLKQVSLYGIESVEAGAFGYCSNLVAVILRSTSTVCVCDLNAFYNTPMLTGAGHVYVPASMYEYYRAGYEAAMDQLIPGFFGILFRKLEDYTVDGTVTGDLDESKI